MNLLRTTLLVTLLFAINTTALEPVISRPSPPQRELLGKNVTLTFEIEGESYAVTTARRPYRLNSSGTISTEDRVQGASTAPNAPTTTTRPSTNPVPASNAKHESTEHSVQLAGEVDFVPGTEQVAITCTGQFQMNWQSVDNIAGKSKEEHEEIFCEIDASTLLKPGEKRTIARSGEHALTLSVEIED